MERYTKLIHFNVDDQMEGIMCLMNSEKGFAESVNVGKPNVFTQLELVENIIDLTGLHLSSKVASTYIVG